MATTSLQNSQSLSGWFWYSARLTSDLALAGLPDSREKLDTNSTLNTCPQVLENRDIMTLICKEIALLEENTGNLTNRRQTFYKLAQVCRAVIEPALDFLWEILPSITPLLLLLPSFMLVENAYVSSFVFYKLSHAKYLGRSWKISDMVTGKDLSIMPVECEPFPWNHKRKRSLHTSLFVLPSSNKATCYLV